MTGSTEALRQIECHGSHVFERNISSKTKSSDIDTEEAYEEHFGNDPVYGDSTGQVEGEADFIEFREDDSEQQLASDASALSLVAATAATASSTVAALLL